METKYESCVLQVKAKSPQVNPWAVCTKNIGRPPKIHIGPRGGKYYMKNGRKIYISSVQ